MMWWVIGGWVVLVVLGFVFMTITKKPTPPPPERE